MCILIIYSACLCMNMHTKCVSINNALPSIFIENEYYFFYIFVVTYALCWLVVTMVTLVCHIFSQLLHSSCLYVFKYQYHTFPMATFSGRLNNDFAFTESMSRWYILYFNHCTRQAKTCTCLQIIRMFWIFFHFKKWI